MKHFLLLGSLVPCLALAQLADRSKAGAFLRMSPLQTRAAEVARLDSVYEYQGDAEQETLAGIVYHEYDEAGVRTASYRKTKNGDKFEPSLKIEYRTYHVGDTLVEEEVRSVKYGRADWTPSSKTLLKKDRAGYVVGEYDYMYKDGAWVNDSFLSAVEYDGEVPVAYMDSTWEGQADASIQRWRVSYSKEHPLQVDTFWIDEWDERAKEWTLSDRSIQRYDEAGRQTRQSYETLVDGAWVFDFDYTYIYDTYGNLTLESDIDDEPDANPYLIRYKNFYSNGMATHNEAVAATLPCSIRYLTAERSLKIDLAEGETAQLFVVSMQGVVAKRACLAAGTNRIAVGDLCPGCYVVRVQGAEAAYTRMFIF